MQPPLVSGMNWASKILLTNSYKQHTLKLFKWLWGSCLDTVEVKVTAFAKIIASPHLYPLYISTWFVAMSFALLLAVICLWKSLGKIHKATTRGLWKVHTNRSTIKKVRTSRQPSSMVVVVCLFVLLIYVGLSPEAQRGSSKRSLHSLARRLYTMKKINFTMCKLKITFKKEITFSRHSSFYT